MVAVLWCHTAFIPLFAVGRGFSVLHAAAETAIVATAALLATSSAFSRRTRTMAASLGLLSCSAVLVHLAGGVIEMHFHFFVMVALVTLYQDWLPFLAAVAYVFIHHGLLGAVAPESVFNHLAAQNHPWRWAGIHALFITGLSVVCLVTWRMNETLLDQRRATEEQLTEESRIAHTLYEVGVALALELDTERVVRTVTDTATKVTHAEFGAFFYNVTDDDGESYMLYRLSGAPMEAFSKFGLPRNTDIFRPTFEGTGTVRLDDVTADPRYGRMAPHYGMPKGHPAVRSYLAVPVRSRDGAVLGGLFFGHPEPGRFTATDERIVTGIAAQAAIALDNARLYESERQARNESELAGARLGLLAEATRLLTASLELDVVLDNLASLVAGEIADACLIDLIEDDGSIRRAAAQSAPGIAFPVDGFDGGPPRPGDRDHPTAMAIRSGQSQIVDDARASTQRTVLPLLGRHEILGAITLVSARPSTDAVGAEYLGFAEELARRAAIAMENARLYARQRTVAETLQHSLLPERLPDVPGLSTAAVYVPGGPDVDIGGDWYDVIQLPGGAVGVAMGDVVGRGERAASLMGQVRNAARAYAAEGRSPAQVLEALNWLLLDSGADRMATMVYAVIDLSDGTLRFANAGHPPPLVAPPGGEPVFLEGARALPIGALATTRYTDDVVSLAPGATLVLYTDGLVEARDIGLETGLARLRDAVRSGPADLDALCRHVLLSATADGHGHDDVAVLAVQLAPLGDRVHFSVPTDSLALAPLRATLRRWLGEAGASDLECQELLTACGEACTNAIRHAGGSTETGFEVEARLDGFVEICVRDKGQWREPRRLADGRGLHIIEAFADEVEITKAPTGTEIRIRRQLSEPRVTVPG